MYETRVLGPEPEESFGDDMSNAVSQLCPKCQKLFVAEKGNPRASPREIVREIWCPACLKELPGAALAETFKEKK